jgi:hypothetical protein
MAIPGGILGTLVAIALCFGIGGFFLSSRPWRNTTEGSNLLLTIAGFLLVLVGIILSVSLIVQLVTG